MLFAVVDVFDRLLAVGHYEYRITVVTHGNPDVVVAEMAYSLFAHVLDGLGDVPGVPDQVSTAGRAMWALALLLALVAGSVWLYRVRGRPRMETATVGWLGATVLLEMVSVAYDAIAAPPNPSIDGVLATRPVAYPLWMVSTIVLVMATFRIARMIRRTTAGALISAPTS